MKSSNQKKKIFFHFNSINSIDRIVWALVFCTGLTMGIYFSMSIYDKWVTSPILITIQSANTPLNERFYFPTVTVCSVNKVSTRALRNWMDTDKYSPLDPANINDKSMFIFIILYSIRHRNRIVII